MIEVLLTPEHLKGAKVEHVTLESGHSPSEYPPKGEKRIFILDRKHPTEQGRITIAEEDCTTHFVPSLAELGVTDACPQV